MELYQSMNKYLADQQVMYIKLHNIHWYVRGNSFFIFHEKTEELYEETAKIIDEVAERLLALDHSPVANLKAILSISCVKELEDQEIKYENAGSILISDLEYLVKSTKEIISLAEKNNDCVTTDMFVNYLEKYEKLIWMLKSCCK